MISIICCFNNEEMLENMLLESLKKQTLPYELITLDNSKGEYPSAAIALNEGAKKSSGDYLMFVHQDVELLERDFLVNMVDVINSYKNEEVILGVAGVKDSSGTYSNIIHGVNKVSAGTQIRIAEQMQTLDEVLLFMRKSVFENLLFNQTLCEGWHLYGVELCLRANMVGIKPVVIPSRIYHFSAGKIDSRFVKTVIRIAWNYRRDYNVIFSTCAVVGTSYVGILYYIFKVIMIKFYINVVKKAIKT